MPSSLYIPFLLAGMILTGSSNSLWSKWQDMQCVENCADPNPAKHVLYEQPVWQTLQMFLGEMLCVSLVGLSGSLIKDAVKDAFVGNVVPSLANSRRALASVSAEEPEASKVLVGVFFILFAQIFTATQFVVEEKIMGRYSVAPLVAVGWEGFFGAITILFFFPILSIPSIAEKSTFFDLPRGWYQMINTPTVLYSGIAIAFSIALFNYFGLSVTRHVSATARSLTDTCRTLSIWIISLGLGWEKFIWPISLLQVLGFSLLVYGTFLFNNLISPPPCLPGPPPSSEDEPRTAAEEEQGLLSSTLDETAALPAELGQSGFDVVPEGQHAIAQGKVASPRSD
ncbi:hypothetical protein ONZ45_g2225 [Pleurotus djamor]|nr:hypothetical protein ONZ45_g2225 [Pleurotus djamor]